MARLRGIKIYLRPMTNEDTDLIVGWRNNRRVRDNFIYRETFTREIHENWIRTKVETGEVVQLIICDIENDRPVGSVYLRDIDMAELSAEYGIFIGEDDAIGKGFGSEACVLMCGFAAEELGLKKLILRVFSDNIPAMKSYEHAGFKKVRDLPEIECSDGDIRDMFLMEKTL